MRKIIAVVVVILLANRSYSQVHFGIKGGPDLATVRYLNEDNSKARVAFHFGALVEIPLQENLFVRPELLYSGKGYDYSANEFSREGSVRLNYINVPLLLAFRPTPKTSILAGPELGFLGNAVSHSTDFTDDLTALYRKFDLGFDLGFAYYFNTSAGFETRYNYGFKDLVNTIITDNAGNIIGQGKTGANSVLQISFFC